MRNQKCLIYKRCIVTDPPQKEANDTYKCFDIACHESIKIENEKLKYTPSSIDIQTILPTKICQNVSNENRLQKCKHTSAKADKEPDTSYSATSSYETSTNSSTSLQDEYNVTYSSEKRRPGRPQGSKNKKTLEWE